MKQFDYPELPPKTRPRRLLDKRSVFYSTAVLIMFGVLVALLLHVSPAPVAEPEARNAPSRSEPVGPRGAVWTPAHQREYAQKLASKGLKAEAAEAFRDYLASADIPNPERASVLFTMGKLLFETGKYEAALAAFYQTEVAGASGDLKQEIDRKVVACLEKLGKPFDAQAELQQRTALVPSKQTGDPRDQVIARIGDDSITLGQLHDELQKLQQSQPKLAEEMQADRSKLLQFIKQLVFERVLARKARRMGIDQQPEFRKEMEELIDRALAQVLISQEIREKVKVDPSDLQTYYQAHPEKYVQPGRAQVRHILLDKEADGAKVLALAREGKDFAQLAREHSKDPQTSTDGGKLKQPVVQGNPDIPGVGKAAEFVQAVFATKPGDLVPSIVPSPAGFHVIRVDEIMPGRPLSFEESKQWVAYDYQVEKSQAAINKMLQETLEVERVQIYDDLILGPKGPIEFAPKE